MFLTILAKTENVSDLVNFNVLMQLLYEELCKAFEQRQITQNDETIGPNYDPNMARYLKLCHS